MISHESGSEHSRGGHTTSTLEDVMGVAREGMALRFSTQEGEGAGPGIAAGAAGPQDAVQE